MLYVAPEVPLVTVIVPVVTTHVGCVMDTFGFEGAVGTLLTVTNAAGDTQLFAFFELTL